MKKYCSNESTNSAYSLMIKKEFLRAGGSWLVSVCIAIAYAWTLAERNRGIAAWLGPTLRGRDNTDRRQPANISDEI
jgi:hypothetical protein